MKSCEEHINAASDYFNYSPSMTALETYFYIVCIGHFIYEEQYRQHRSSFDSFLLMYIQAGKLTIEFEDMTQDISAGSFVLLDCYQPHGYYTLTGCECIWAHLDGPVARAHYNQVVSHLGNVFSLHDPYPMVDKMQKLYSIFANKKTIREAMVSRYITDILTAMILYQPLQLTENPHALTTEDLVSYINEHFRENLTIRELAEKAMQSPYYFIRVFKKETGFTPHEYLVNTRIRAAKYLLKKSRMPVKDICFHTGFSSESVFCTSFKKRTGISPTEFRKLG